MKDKNLIDALKSVDNARMEKLNLDELTDVELKSLDEILNPTPKCEKKKWQCIDFRRWVAVAAAIVLLIVFIPKNGADAGFIKVIIEEKPGHIEYKVIKNKETPSDEKEFIVDYVVDGYELVDLVTFHQNTSYEYRNKNNDYYVLTRYRLDVGQSGMYSTTGRIFSEIELNGETITIISNNNSTTLFWFSKYYLYDIVGFVSEDEALKLAKNIISINK